MHSGDRLTGRICKCMDCARAREEKVRRWIERNRPEEWADIREKEFDVVDLRQEADDLERKARADLAELRGPAIEELKKKEEGA